jgi:hypothetical protein
MAKKNKHMGLGYSSVRFWVQSPALQKKTKKKAYVEICEREREEEKEGRKELGSILRKNTETNGDGKKKL